MKIVHISAYDVQNGAAKAAYRLHTAMRETGHQSRMIVLSKGSQDHDVLEAEKKNIWHLRLMKLFRMLPLFKIDRPSTNHWFDLDTEPDIRIPSLCRVAGDNVHIICLYLLRNMLSVKRLASVYQQLRCPLVWILMDMAPLTGGCHHPLECERYKEQCGQCPQLRQPGETDRSRVVWGKKKKYLQHLPITFIAPTRWLVHRIQESSLFGRHRVDMIPLALDSLIFRPFAKAAARELLRIPQEKKIIFIGSSFLDDERKGMSYLIKALERLHVTLDSSGRRAIQNKDIFLLIAGRNENKLIDSLSFPYRHLGFIRDDLVMALAYQAADVFVCPSIYDAGPMMIPEAMLCGTPVVAFDTGGAPDLIKTMETGYLAKFKDAEDLAVGMDRVLSSERLSVLGEEARKVAVEKHDISIVAQKYTELFQTITDASH
jgi:glycosyltransferase involved in cell wall biosynthesis